MYCFVLALARVNSAVRHLSFLGENVASHKIVKPLLAASLVTMALGFAGLLIALLASTSGTHGNGISAYAGGVSVTLLNFVLLVLLIVFVALFFVARRTFK
jgi:hypothetical protein